MKYIKEYHLDASMCGSDARMNILNMAQITQNAVTCALDAYLLSNIEMRKYGLMWVFSKIRYEIENNLEWDEYYRVESFVSFKSRIVIYVDNQVFDKDNKILFTSRVEMCAVDIASRKIVRLDDVPNADKLEIYNGSTLSPFMRFMGEEDGEVIYQKRVGYSSMDFSHHTNNIEYIRFILDSFKDFSFEQYQFEAFEIHYLKESQLGDDLYLYKKDNVYTFKCNGNIITKAIFIERK